MTSARKRSTSPRSEFGLARHFLGGVEHLIGGGAGLARRLGDAGDVGRHLVGAGRGLLHVARDLLGRRTLLLDRRGDRGRDLVDLADRLADALDRRHRVPVEAWMAAICAPISSVAFAVWLARFLTSDATTAKPLPASPARAASIVALSASRLVWPAMSLISLTTSPMRCAASARPCTVALVRSALVDRLPGDARRLADLAADLLDRRDSSSAARATVWTLVDACSEALATAVAWRLVSSAVALIVCADPAAPMVDADTALHHAGDAAIEILGARLEPAARALPSPRAPVSCSRGQRVGAQHVLLEHQHGLGHGADLVLAVGAGDFGLLVAVGERASSPWSCR